MRPEFVMKRRVLREDGKMGYGFRTKQRPELRVMSEKPEMVVNRYKDIYDSGYKITERFPNGCWRGFRAFVIGAGESMIGFDYSKLFGEFTITVNRGLEAFNSTINYSMDTRFYDQLWAGEIDKHTGEPVLCRWTEYKGVKVWLCPVNKYDFREKVYLVGRIDARVVNRDLEMGIFGGSNSGFGAMMLALALGANPVYLLGFDMKVKEKTHCHSGYPKQTFSHQKSATKSFIECFNMLAPAISESGAQVINLGPDSELECFRKQKLEEVLK